METGIISSWLTFKIEMLLKESNKVRIRAQAGARGKTDPPKSKVYKNLYYVRGNKEGVQLNKYSKP